jgi:glycerol uptake facilitator-like aquaporin
VRIGRIVLCPSQIPACAAIPWLVGLYIIAGYWFTASTSFANPAVTIARALTDTFSGLRPADVSLFILAQIVGALAALAVMGWLLKSSLWKPS